MHNTNDLRFAMAVHLLQRSNPATRQGVHRHAGHRALDPTTTGTRRPRADVSSFARIIVRVVVHVVMSRRTHR